MKISIPGLIFSILLISMLTLILHFGGGYAILNSALTSMIINMVVLMSYEFFIKPYIDFFKGLFQTILKK